MPRSYVAGTATAVTAVAAIPTTTAHFSLWNGEPVGGKTYTITTIGMTTTTSAAATMIMQQLAHLSVKTLPLITGTAASAIRSTDGLPVASRAVVFGSVTIVNANGLWHPVGQAVNSAALTATIGFGAWTPVRGLYYLPPGGILSLAALASTAAGGVQHFIQWEE